MFDVLRRRTPLATSAFHPAIRPAPTGGCRFPSYPEERDLHPIGSGQPAAVASFRASIGTRRRRSAIAQLCRRAVPGQRAFRALGGGTSVKSLAGSAGPDAATRKVGMLEVYSGRAVHRRLCRPAAVDAITPSHLRNRRSLALVSVGSRTSQVTRRCGRQARLREASPSAARPARLPRARPSTQTVLIAREGPGRWRGIT